MYSVPLPADHDPAIYTMLTCLNGYYHWLYNPSMAEVLINTPNKGAVIAWASSSLTTPDIQQEMAKRFYLRSDRARFPEWVILSAMPKRHSFHPTTAPTSASPGDCWEIRS